MKLSFSTFCVAASFLGFSTTPVKAQVNPNGFPNPIPDWQLQCEVAIQVVCGSSVSGNTLASPGATLVPSSELGCTNYQSQGVFYKLSLGQDQVYDLTLSTCNVGTNYDSSLQLFTGSECGPDNGPDATLACDAFNDDDLSNDPTCFPLKARIGGLNPFADTDYWILVEGFLDNTGDFTLDVTCEVPSIDPWFIQRSAFPPPDVTNIDPLQGGTWLELHPDRVPDVVGNPSNIPGLAATAHAILPGEPCDAGPVIPGFTIANEACDPADPACPLLMSPNSVPVLQTFDLPSPFTYGPPAIWFLGAGNYDGQFQFCVHTQLLLDYDPDIAGEEEVSYFDTFYVVDIDFTSEVFIQNVAALARTPQNIDDLFDSFNVIPYLCGDDNLFPLNAPFNPPNANDEFLVGENFRICLKPDPQFSNFEIEQFNDVKCVNTGEDRDVIVNGNVPPPEVPLTSIFTTTSAVRPAPPNGIAFESTVTSGFETDGSFLCTGTVEMDPIVIRRRLQEQGGTGDEVVTGSFAVTLTVIKPGLSTGAKAAIGVSASVIFVITMFILYRRGCFSKRIKNKPPKTVSIDVVSVSETTSEEDKHQAQA